MVLFLGNSLTAGYGVGADRAFPALIQAKIYRAGLHLRVVNAGISGATTADGLAQIGWLMRGPVAVLVLELGANDALRGQDLAATDSNLQAIIDSTRARHPDVRIVIAGMKAPPNLGPDYTRRFDAIFPRVARRNDAALVPFLLQDVAGHPELNQADGIHPTAEGHRIVAENVWRVLEPILRSIETAAAFDHNAQDREWLEDHCLPIKDGYGDDGDILRSCRVNEFGRFASLPGEDLYYGLYRQLALIPEQLEDTSFLEIAEDHPYNNTAVAVFESPSGGGGFRAIWAEFIPEFGVAFFERPRLLETPAGQMVRIPYRVPGTGNGNDDRYLLRRGNRWALLETDSWLEDLAHRLPAGRAVLKGVVPDLEAMRAEAPVWKEGDANCCPTGGRVDVGLALRRDRLVITRFRYEPDTTVSGRLP